VPLPNISLDLNALSIIDPATGLAEFTCFHSKDANHIALQYELSGCHVTLVPTVASMTMDLNLLVPLFKQC
jgi:hypothetical protein